MSKRPREEVAGTTALPARPALVTAKDYRDYANQLRECFRTLEDGKLKDDVECAFMNIDLQCEGLKDDDTPSADSLERLNLNLRPLSPAYEQFIASINQNFGFWKEAADVRPLFADRVAFYADKTRKELERVVRVPVVVETALAKEVSKLLSNTISRVTVLTGESGGGKTMGSIVGSVCKPNHYALYLGYVLWPEKAASDSNATYDKNIANLLMGTVEAMLRQRKVPPKPPRGEADVVLSLIFDEMGGHPTALRSLCRLSMIDSTKDPTRDVNKEGLKMFAFLKELLGTKTIRIVAVGTGCDDVKCQVGLHPNSYRTVRACAADGEALWHEFSKSFTGVDAFTELVFAGTGGSTAGTDVLRKVPSGAATAETGAQLRGNARMAALMNMRVVGMPRDAPAEATNAAALGIRAVAVSKAIQVLSVRHFITLNSLARFSSGERMSMCAVAFGVAMSCSDSPLTGLCFDNLCCTTGLLTSHAVITRGTTGRTVNRYAGDPTLGEGERLAVADNGARYRVSPAIGALYLMEFGATPRSTSGNDFELFVIDYLMVAVPAAAAASYLGLSPAPAAPPRNGLFDLLVAAFRKCNCGMLRSIGRCVLTQQCVPCKHEGSASPPELASASQDVLKQAWDNSMALRKGKAELQVLIVQNAPAADIIVLCKDMFALHVQCESLQESLSVDDVRAEFVNMKASSTMFPQQYRALVYWSADTTTAAAFKENVAPAVMVNGVVSSRRVVVSTFPRDPAFLPLSVPSRKEKASDSQLQAAVFADNHQTLGISKPQPSA